MTQINGTVFCFAYILGLLATGVANGGYNLIAIGFLVTSLSYFGKRSILRSKLHRNFWHIKPQIWLLAGLVGFSATIYFQIRTPHPSQNDVSKFVTANAKDGVQVVTVQGKISSTPRLTRNQRSQFWLEPFHLNIGNDIRQDVSGKLYTTVPLLQATGLHEGARITVTGILYKPKSANNPRGFNFQAYLAREGSFAGLKGKEVSLIDSEINKEINNWGWWAVRQKILHSQVHLLGVPEGVLASAMVLGNRVVDLPFSVSDSFIRVGLAHALAASGFQVSLILGVVLAIAQHFSNRIQFIIGVSALLIFLGLTGLQPSVLRAVIMGIGALTALALEQKFKPLGLLLLAATLLLTINPIWIWDLGFEFSFLATLGLIVTVPALIKKIDWLPPAIGTLIAVPISAYIWTIPLQIYNFGLISPYSILVNIITTIPISIISLGAFISAIVALIHPTIGSALAWLLYYPTHCLIELVDFVAGLPGAATAVGTISSLQLIIIYSLFILTCSQKWWRKKWWVVGLVTISLVFIPAWQTQASLFQVTVLAAGKEPVLVIQDRSRVLLLNSGDETTSRFIVLPFLQQQGINQLDWAVAAESNSTNNINDWSLLLQNLSVKNFYNCPSRDRNTTITSKLSDTNCQQLLPDREISTGSTFIKLLDAQQQILQIQIQDRTWLILGETEIEKTNKRLPHAQVLVWSGEKLDSSLIAAVKPEVAIASRTKLDPKTIAELQQGKTKVFLTGRDGAVQWTPKGKFEIAVETVEDKASAL
ncbi:ComEC/Rec2 family competence protein [Chroococcidiopsis sp.]|uniref:ComEC/Rec2 family competence protein n=1 Tax=Chroococcidiopsis sp. TaxID=3088168 RepID=UPI003F3FC727